jgi:hypothetical protein
MDCLDSVLFFFVSNPSLPSDKKRHLQNKKHHLQQEFGSGFETKKRHLQNGSILQLVA